MLFTPEISVCMPMHNASRYLRECIGSVLAQTYADFEFLIADDGSTDDSVAIVESYADPRIRLIKRPHDYIATLNCLLDEARGKYIARMDADDLMLPHRLQIQFDYMEAHPDVDLLGSMTSSSNVPAEYTDAYRDTEAKEITFRNLVNWNNLDLSTALFRSDALRRTGIRYSESYPGTEEYKLWSELAKSGSKMMAPDALLQKCLTKRREIVDENSEEMRRIEIIRHENNLWATKQANPDYTEPQVKDSGNKITVIIPFLNEGSEVMNTVASVRKYGGKSVDIFVINDFSYDGIDYGEALKPFDVYYFVNFEHKGVAASRDFGVAKCKTPYFLLLDAHMRFYESEVFNTIASLLASDDRQLLCCQSIAIDYNAESGEFEPRKNYPLAYGAYIPMIIGKPLPDIDWKQAESNPGSDVEEIPVVLGAGYAASCRYWQYLRGLEGLESYGLDEDYISIKVWLEGGKCVLLKRHILGHFYRNRSPYFTYRSDSTHNALLVAELLMPRRKAKFCYASAMYGNYGVYAMALDQLSQKAPLINELKDYYHKIFTRTYSYFEAINRKEFDALRAKSMPKMQELYMRFTATDGLQHPESISLTEGSGFDVLARSIGGRIFTDYNDAAGFADAYNYYIAKVESAASDPSFGRGLFGAGWLIIYLHRETLALHISYRNFDTSYFHKNSGLPKFRIKFAAVK